MIISAIEWCWKSGGLYRNWYKTGTIAQKKKHAKRVLNYVRCSVSIIHARDS